MPKFKINRSALIAEVRQNRVEAEKRFAADLEAHADKLARWQRDTTAVLQRAIKAVEKGRAPSERKRYSSSTYVEFEPIPERPTKASYVAGFDRVIAYLRKIAGDTITIDQETYEKWIAGRRV